MTSTNIPNPIRDDDLGEHLRPGTNLLQGQYTVERFLGSGGFALTYLARDSLDRPIVIKECFPGSLCVRSRNSVRARSRSHVDELNNIVRLFFREAQRLAKLRHPNIVGVHQVFQDNGTAYMALDYIDGPDLLHVIDDSHRQIDPEELREILSKLLNAIAYVHEQNVLHRDISPDNILLFQSETPVLIDFGAAREQATQASRVLSSLQVVKDGYSPQEFYITGAEQGPQGDIYALGATFYHLITGQAPPNSQIRLAAVAANDPDPYRALTGNVPEYDRAFLHAIDKALSIFPNDRHQSAAEWLHCIDERKRRAAALATARRNAEIDKAISKLVQETNKELLGSARKKSGTAQKVKPEPERKKKAFFSWQTEADWLFRDKAGGVPHRGSSSQTPVDPVDLDAIVDDPTPGASGSDAVQQVAVPEAPSKGLGLLASLNQAFRSGLFTASPRSKNSQRRTFE